MNKVIFERALITNVYLSEGGTSEKTGRKYADKIYVDLITDDGTLRCILDGYTELQLRELSLQPVSIEAVLVIQRFGNNGQLIVLKRVVIRLIILEADPVPSNGK